jgi:hypothetical protein
MTQTERASDEVVVHGKDAEGKDANGDSPKNRELEMSGRSTAEPSRADVASDSHYGAGGQSKWIAPVTAPCTQRAGVC